MKINPDVAIMLSAQLTYQDMIGMGKKVNGKSFKDNTGTRKLKENNWRDVDIDNVLEALDISQNKFMLLRLLPRMELFEILLLLDKEQLINGLMFLPKEQLVFLIMQLPKELLLKLLLYLMPLKDLVKEMPAKEIFGILKDRKITVKELVQAFKEAMPEKFLQFIMMKMTQADTSHLQKDELLSMFQQFRKREIIEGMKYLPFKALQPLIMNLIEKDPELLMNLSRDFIFKMINRYPKANLVDACRVLPDEIILEFLDQLPDFFLAMVAEQVDDSVFTQYLLSQQQNLLFYLGTGMELPS
jgi:hypothetical protein